MTIGDKIREYRESAGLTQNDVAKFIDVTPQTIYKYEKGIVTNIPIDKIEKLAKLFHIEPVDLTEWTNENLFSSEELVSLPIIGKIAAGYDMEAVEEPTGDWELLPRSALHGQPESEFFVLVVTGNSMYPRFIEGDRVLVKRCVSVDSGSIAVVLYDGDEATIKKVNYVYGEDWLELIPINPEYTTKRIEGSELGQCRVLGKVIKLMRDIL